MASRIPGKLKLRDLSCLSPEYDEVIALSKALLQPQHPMTTAILGAVMVEHELLAVIHGPIDRHVLADLAVFE